VEQRGQLVEQVEHSGVGPVHVLEHEQGRLACRERLHEPPRGAEQRRAVGRLSSGSEGDQRGEMRRDLRRILRPDQRFDRGAQLVRCRLLRVGVEDAGHLLHVRAEGGIRRARAVRRRPSSQRAAAQGAHALAELEGEARLPDAGRAEERHELRAALVDDAAPDAGEQLELPLPADHGGLRKPPLAGVRDRLHGEPDADRLSLSACDDRVACRVLDRASSAAVGLLADDDAVHRCVHLQPGGGVDDVAGDHRLAELRPGSERRDRLARVDRDPDLEVELRVGVVEVVDRVADRERGAHRSLRVVAERDGRAEDGHDRVADELLDMPPKRSISTRTRA
jgi:hypothetical protein